MHKLSLSFLGGRLCRSLPNSLLDSIIWNFQCHKGENDPCRPWGAGFTSGVWKAAKRSR